MNKWYCTYLLVIYWQRIKYVVADVPTTSHAIDHILTRITEIMFKIQENIWVDVLLIQNLDCSDFLSVLVMNSNDSDGTRTRDLCRDRVAR